MRGPFTHDFLLVFAGPLVWAVHFLAIYGFTGIVCARSLAGASWFGIGIIPWGIGGAGLAAIAVIALLCLGVKPQAATPDNRSFVRWMGIGLGLLSITGIAFETLTVFIIPACA